MNILLFSNLFPNPLEPERGNFIALMVEELAKQHSVHVVSPLPWFPDIKLLQKINGMEKWKKFAAIPYMYEYKGIKTYYPKYPFLPKVGVPFQAFSIYLSAFPIVKRLVKEKGGILINAHWIYPDGVAAVRIAKKLSLPCVISARGCDINLFGRYVVKKFQISWALKNADAITVVSHALKERVTNDFQVNDSKVTVIPNGVDRTVFRPMNRDECRAQVAIKGNKKVLLFAGQLHEVKGVNFLIEALSLLRKKGKLTFDTIIVGDGPLSTGLRREVEDLGLSDQVVFKGNQPHSMVASYFEAADLLCLPSIREGRPNVVIEALSVGLPVAASNVGGIPELVNSENGILTNPGDPIDLANALEAGMNREWDRKKISAKQNSNSWESCANNYIKLYTNVLSKKHIASHSRSQKEYLKY